MAPRPDTRELSTVCQDDMQKEYATILGTVFEGFGSPYVSMPNWQSPRASVSPSLSPPAKRVHAYAGIPFARRSDLIIVGSVTIIDSTWSFVILHCRKNSLSFSSARLGIHCKRECRSPCICPCGALAPPGLSGHSHRRHRLCAEPHRFRTCHNHAPLAPCIHHTIASDATAPTRSQPARPLVRTTPGGNPSYSNEREVPAVRNVLRTIKADRTRRQSASIRPDGWQPRV